MTGGRGLPAGAARGIADWLAAAMVLVVLGWAVALPRFLGFGVYPQQMFAIVLGCAMAMGFLVLPARRGAGRGDVPWLDVALAGASLAVMAYIAFGYPRLVLLIFSRPPEVWLPGIVAIGLMLEALRRASGWALVLIIATFLGYGLFGDLLPGRLSGRAMPGPILAGYMAFDSNGILGLPLSIAATVVVAFVLFGGLLSATGGSAFFTDAAMLAMGRFRGGSMKIAVLASGLFGSISGSAVANVAGTGVVTIPMIKRDGYPAHRAAAIEAVASTGGQLMPPVMGASAFLMAEFLEVSYASVVTAALAPALLYYIALFIQADLEAARRGIAAVPRSLMPPPRGVMGGLHFVLPFAALIHALFVLRWQPDRAALAAAVVLVASALVFGYRGNRPGPWVFLRGLVGAGHAAVEILLISAASGIVIGVLNVTGLSFNLTYALVQLGGGSLAVLLALSAMVCIVLGMGLPTLGVYVLLATLVAPALIQLGVEPIAAHLYVLYFGMMSMITPPIALAAFTAAAIAEARPMATGLAAVRFGWTAYVIPVLFVFSPTLLMIGAPLDIGLALLTATVGVWLVSAALAGYLGTRLSAPMRLGLAAAGLLALVPAGAFPGAALGDLLGTLAGFALAGVALRRGRRARSGGSTITTEADG